MSRHQSDQVIHPVPQPGLLQDIQAFLIDRQARRLSPATVKFYGNELRHMRVFLETRQVRETCGIKPTHVLEYLLHLGQTHSGGGLHVAYRTVRAYLNWWEAEYEPQHWTNPIKKTAPPRPSRDLLQPLPLDDLRAMVQTCKGHSLADDRDRALLLAVLDTACCT